MKGGQELDGKKFRYCNTMSVYCLFWHWWKHRFGEWFQTESPPFCDIYKNTFFVVKNYFISIFTFPIIFYMKRFPPSPPHAPPAPPTTPHFFHTTYKIWENGRIFTFKLSKQPCWCVWHDRIIFKWYHNTPGSENFNLSSVVEN